jgi:hypothetical protein
MAAKRRQNGGQPAENPRLVEKEDNLLSERGLFSFCFSLNDYATSTKQ